MHWQKSKLQNADLNARQFPNGVCEVGTVVKIPDCQAEGPGFNSRPGRGLNFGRPSFATPSHVKPLVQSRPSIGGLKRTHTLVDKIRLMPVLWTVTFSTTKGARPRRDHVYYCLCSCCKYTLKRDGTFEIGLDLMTSDPCVAGVSSHFEKTK